LPRKHGTNQEKLKIVWNREANPRKTMTTENETAIKNYWTRDNYFKANSNEKLNTSLVESTKPLRPTNALCSSDILMQLSEQDSNQGVQHWKQTR